MIYLEDDSLFRVPAVNLCFPGYKNMWMRLGTVINKYFAFLSENKWNIKVISHSRLPDLIYLVEIHVLNSICQFYFCIVIETWMVSLCFIKAMPLKSFIISTYIYHTYLYIYKPFRKFHIYQRHIFSSFWWMRIES